MRRTCIIRRDYLHYIKKYNRFEKRHSNVACHVSPAFRLKEGDEVLAGECRPLSKTVRFNLLKIEKTSAGKEFSKFWENSVAKSLTCIKWKDKNKKKTKKKIQADFVEWYNDNLIYTYCSIHKPVANGSIYPNTLNSLSREFLLWQVNTSFNTYVDSVISSEILLRDCFDNKSDFFM